MKPTGSLIAVAKRIYRSTPYPPLRRFYFEAFARAVRKRRVRAVVEGVAFDLDLGETIDLAVLLGEFERSVARALAQYCKPGMTALDIGANIGAHALRLAAAAGPGGQVYAFEPTQYAFTKLTRNISLNPQLSIQAFHLALGSAPATARAADFRSSWRTDGSSTPESSIVDFVRLDDWAAERRVQNVHLVKIDVDGNEYDVLSGGVGLLEAARPVIVAEAVGPHFDHTDRNPFRLLESLGYRIQGIDGTPFESLEALRALLPPHDPGMTVSVNVVALPGAER